MIIYKKPGELHDLLEKKKIKKQQVGFVPTMGALHAGHLSLVNEAKKQNKIVVCSIFVNPTQFNDPEDFKKYPITVEKDILMFEEVGCDVLLIPSVQDIYPNGIDHLSHYELGFLETVLEGKFRPRHFQGVCQVMHRLLEIVLPNNLYLGQKDYQQCMVIKKLIELIGLSDKMKVNICPTLREDDGLAMSSRNTRLLPDDRKKAATISATLRYIKENLKTGDTKKIKDEAKEMLLQKYFRIDYIEIADAGTLELVENWNGKQKVVALVAAFLNKVRLIDNMVINT
ncbi:MAG TPA: pantoate--beta-alanine ligase [Chitinophagaceae bacterium]|jgi:pantoate--beta-alanine ligase|nr:pantoate--beta-alanine ligase [Chitinophagaceae bacterium]